MKARFARTATVAMLTSLLIVAGCGTTPATRTDTTELVHVAQTTLERFYNDPQMHWLRAHLGQARAVVISPRMTRAAFFFGGAGGEALVLARDRGGRWAGPAFYNLGAGTVGVQFGVEVSEVVMLVMSDKALDALLSRSFKLGGDVSVAAGPVGVGKAATVGADMISFARSKGAYVGIGLDGALIAPDEAANHAFYGRPASPADILVRGSVDSRAAAPLQQTLRTLAVPQR